MIVQFLRIKHITSTSSEWKVLYSENLYFLNRFKMPENVQKLNLSKKFLVWVYVCLSVCVCDNFRKTTYELEIWHKTKISCLFQFEPHDDFELMGVPTLKILQFLFSKHFY